MTIVMAICLFAAIPIEDEIRHLEKVRVEAVLHNDTKILADLYADGMTTIAVAAPKKTSVIVGIPVTNM